MLIKEKNMPNYNLIKTGLMDLTIEIDDMTPLEVADTFEALRKIVLNEMSADKRLDAMAPLFEKPAFVDEDRAESILYRDNKVVLFLVEYNYSKPEHLKLAPSLHIKIGNTIQDATKLDGAIKTLLPFDLTLFLERFEIAEQKYYEMRPIMFEMGK